MKISNLSFKKISSFLKDGIWHVERNEVGPIGYFALNVARKLILAIEFTTEGLIPRAGGALPTPPSSPSCPSLPWFSQ